jgi:hypothetical protein
MGTAWERHGMCVSALRDRHGNGMACVNQTRPHNVNQMGKTQSKALAERHGNGMVCVNWPLVSYVLKYVLLVFDR